MGTSLFSGCGAGLLPSALASGSSVAGSPLANANPQPAPAGVVTAGSLTVGSSVAGEFGAGFVGLAYEKQALYEPLFTAENVDLVGLFRRLGPSVLRIGGNSVDANVWVQGGKGRIAGEIAPADVDAFAGFVKATGWQCIYGINLGGSATGVTNPQMAAAEVAYVAQALGDALVGVEIGNECENYRDGDSFYAWNWTVEMFEMLWLEYRAAILSRTPGVAMVGPAAGSKAAEWTMPWAQSVTSRRVGMLSQHYYRGPAYLATATVEELVSVDNALVAELATLKAGAARVGVPFRMGECNSYWSGGQPGVSNAYASALWAVDMIFQCAMGGASGVNFQGGDQGQYALITDTDCVVDGVRPEFYGLMMAAMAGQGTMMTTQLAAAGMNVTSYAVKGGDGRVRIVVVNKDAAQSLRLNVALDGVLTKVASATLVAMTQLSAGAKGPSLSATAGVTIQGAAVGLDGGFAPAAAYTLAGSGTALSCYVPALSAVMIEVA